MHTQDPIESNSSGSDVVKAEVRQDIQNLIHDSCAITVFFFLWIKEKEPASFSDTKVSAEENDSKKSESPEKDLPVSDIDIRVKCPVVLLFWRKRVSKSLYFLTRVLL